MHKLIFKTFLFILITFSMTVVKAQNEKETLENEDIVKNKSYIEKVKYSSIKGQCTESVNPDKVIIYVGVSVESLKPLEAVNILELQLAEIVNYINSINGEVIEKEKVREVREFETTGRKVNIDEKPYILTQPLEIILNTESDLDNVIENLLHLGVNKFGKNVTFRTSKNRPKKFIYYKFASIEELEQLKNSCKNITLENWCKKFTTNNNNKTCSEEFLNNSDLFVISELKIRQSGYGNKIEYPWQIKQIEAIDYQTGDPIDLNISITLKYIEENNN